MQLLRVEKVLSWVCPGFLSHWQARECESTLVESAGVRVYTGRVAPYEVKKKKENLRSLLLRRDCEAKNKKKRSVYHYFRQPAGPAGTGTGTLVRLE